MGSLSQNIAKVPGVSAFQDSEVIVQFGWHNSQRSRAQWSAMGVHSCETCHLGKQLCRCMSVESAIMDFVHDVQLHPRLSSKVRFVVCAAKIIWCLLGGLMMTIHLLGGARGSAVQRPCPRKCLERQLSYDFCEMLLFGQALHILSFSSQFCSKRGSLPELEWSHRHASYC